MTFVPEPCSYSDVDPTTTSFGKTRNIAGAYHKYTYNSDLLQEIPSFGHRPHLERPCDLTRKQHKSLLPFPLQVNLPRAPSPSPLTHPTHTLKYDPHYTLCKHTRSTPNTAPPYLCTYQSTRHRPSSPKGFDLHKSPRYPIRCSSRSRSCNRGRCIGTLDDVVVREPDLSMELVRRTLEENGAGSLVWLVGCRS